jgi:hypothetical protein
MPGVLTGPLPAIRRRAPRPCRLIRWPIVSEDPSSRNVCCWLGIDGAHETSDRTRRKRGLRPLQEIGRGSERTSPSSARAHVSTSPPLLPDGRTARVRLAAAAFREGPSRTTRGSSACPRTALSCPVIPSTRRCGRNNPLSGSRSRRSHVLPSATCRVPLCLGQAFPGPGTRRASPRSALPVLRRSHWLRRPTQWLQPALLGCSPTWSLQVAASPCWKKSCSSRIQALVPAWP